MSIRSVLEQIKQFIMLVFMNTLHYFWLQAITKLLTVTLSQHPLMPYKWYTLASARVFVNNPAFTVRGQFPTLQGYN